MATKQKATRVRQKKWYTIYAPKVFNEQVLGETTVVDTKELLGRVISVSLMELTGDPNKQSTYIKFKITEQKQGGVGTEAIGYYMLQTSSKRRISRSGTKITSSIACKTADAKIVRVKPIIFTKTHIKGSIKTVMRKTLEAILAREIGKREFTTVLTELAFNKIQIAVKEQMKKIYPLRGCDIRFFEIEKEKKQKTVKLVTAAPEPVQAQIEVVAEAEEIKTGESDAQASN
jgi:small subunit ribosomal protein S3Ae